MATEGVELQNLNFVSDEHEMQELICQRSYHEKEVRLIKNAQDFLANIFTML